MQLFAIQICFQGRKSQKAYSATKTSKNYEYFIFAFEKTKKTIKNQVKESDEHHVII